MRSTGIIPGVRPPQESPIFQDRPELPGIGLGGGLPSPLGVARPPQAAGALLALEIDHFEMIERAHGVQLADTVLRRVESALRGVLGTSDLVSRLHGGEFTAWLPGAGAARARGAAEEASAELRRAGVPIGTTGRTIPLTLSIGIALAADHGPGQASLAAAAGRARARVSAQGGDGVALAPPPKEEPATPPFEIRGFVGRSDQSRELVRAIEECLAGRPNLVFVHAEQGVGVSTLVRQMTREARVRGGRAVFARATPADIQPPYGMWRQVVEKLLPATRTVKGDWTELPNLVPGAGSRFAMNAVGTPGSGSQYRLLEELTEWIVQVAAAGPLLVVLEAMQWADSASWDALEHVFTRLGNSPVVVVVTLADDRMPAEVRERRATLGERARVTDVTVPRLTRDEVKRMLERALHRQDVGRELLSFVYGHTRGNALYIHQLLRALLDEGVLWHSGERWEWRPASELRFPPGLEPLLVRRLERLPGRSQLGLATAAVIGRAFEPSLFAAILGGGSAATQEIITEAVRAGLLEPEDPGSSRVRFVHQLVIDVLKSHLTPRRQQRIHRDIAAALAAFSAGDDAEIAAHFDRAGVQREAYARAIAASDGAERLYALASAAECLQLAARNARGPDELAEARARMASLAERMGRFEEAEELCDLAIEWFDSQEEHEQSMSLRLLRERARDQLGQPARRTLEALVQLDQEAAELGLRQERVAVLIALSMAWARLGDHAAAEQIAADTVRMAEELGDARLLATALNRYGVALQHGPNEKSRVVLQRAIALFQQVGDFKGQARAYNNLGISCQRQGDLAGVIEALEMAVAVARTARMPDVWGTAALNLGVFKLKAGDYAEAREFFDQALSLFTAVKAAELQLYALCNLAEVERAEGRQREAAEMFEMAASLAQRIGAVDAELAAAGGAGLALLAEGKLGEATAALQRVAARTVSRADWFQGRELVEALAVLVAVARGDVGEAVRQFSDALRLAATADAYGGAFLTAACAKAIAPHAPELVAEAVGTYAPRVATIGYVELTNRFRELTRAQMGGIS